MADNISISDSSDAAVNVATDDDGSAQHQYVKVEFGGDGTQTKVTSSVGLPVSDAGGSLTVDDGSSSLTVDNAQLSVVGGGTEAAAMRVTIASDSTGVLSVDDNGSSLTVDGTVTVSDGGSTISVDDGSGSITIDSGAILADDADFTDGSTPGINIMGVYESTQSTVTDGDLGVVGITEDRQLRVLDLNSTDISSAVTSLATTVDATELRVNIAVVDEAVPIHDNNSSITVDPQLPASQVWKVYTQTSDSTGALVWDVGASDRINITYCSIANVGTDAGICILYFGADADTTYSEGTDQVVFHGAVTAVAGQVHQITPALGPIAATTAGHSLHITTTGNPDLKVIVYGYISV
jgi:hypothetical protein